MNRSSCFYLTSRLYCRNCKPILKSKLKKNNIWCNNQISDILSSFSDNKKAEYITYSKEDFKSIEINIKKELESSNGLLQGVCQHHFDSAGKYIRPSISMLMSQACNIDHTVIKREQMEVAMIVEMIHTASLVHDDVIDASQVRRGRKTAQTIWGQKKAVLAGNYILATASKKLARIGHIEVIQVLSQVLEDLVAGEFMQMGSKETESERFNHYLTKTYKKTASLIANSCKAVAILSDAAHDMREAAFQFGRNAGIAFQLIDDCLDFTSSECSMGKPVSADLKLGLATAPVLYASMQYPELSALIMRRFSENDDIDRARQLVIESDGVQKTLYLATQHCNEAIRHLSISDKNSLNSNKSNGQLYMGESIEDEGKEGFDASAARNSLIRITQNIISRKN